MAEIIPTNFLCDITTSSWLSSSLITTYQWECVRWLDKRVDVICYIFKSMRRKSVNKHVSSMSVLIDFAVVPSKWHFRVVVTYFQPRHIVEVLRATCHFTTYRHLQFRSRCRFCTSKSFRRLEKWDRHRFWMLRHQLAGIQKPDEITCVIWTSETESDESDSVDVELGRVACTFVTKRRLLTWKKEKMTSQYTGMTIEEMVWQ